MIRAELEALDGPAGERPVRTEVGRDRVVADQPPAALEDRPVDRVWRQARAQGIRRPANASVASRTRPAKGAIGNDPQVIGPSPSVLRSSRPSTVERGEATAGDEVDDRADAGRRELEPLRIGCGVGQADRQRPTAGGRRRRGAGRPWRPAR